MVVRRRKEDLNFFVSKFFSFEFEIDFTLISFIDTGVLTPDIAA